VPYFTLYTVLTATGAKTRQYTYKVL